MVMNACHERSSKTTHEDLSHTMKPLDLSDFDFLPLKGGFLLEKISVTDAPIIDALDRPAAARSTILGSTIRIEISSLYLEATELSISLYHEVLEAAAVASLNPPPLVWEMNEADFESAARLIHDEFGPASQSTLNQMLERFGF
jgi:hypothetical protein